MYHLPKPRKKSSVPKPAAKPVRGKKAFNPEQYNWIRPAIKCGFALGVAYLGFHYFSPGFNVSQGPKVEPVAFTMGQELFKHEWIPGDPFVKSGGSGLGPVYNAASCVECHNQGGTGGGGSNAHNVHTFEVTVDAVGQKTVTGGIHAHALDDAFAESSEVLDKLYPKRTIIVNTINTTALFGEGWIDRISDQAIRFQSNAQSVKETKTTLAGDLSAIPAGRARVLPDGRIGKFGWKAQFATLDEFVAAACGNEIGLTTPKRAKATPLGHVAKKTKPDMTEEQYASMVSYVEALPRPEQVSPHDPEELARAEHGKALFDSVGCSVCHVSEMSGVKGVYSDFLLHKISPPRPKFVDASSGGAGYYSPPPPPPSLPGSDEPAPDEWRTPPLWGVAESAPYFHDGSAPTLEAAILEHGGSALTVTNKFKDLPGSEQEAIVAFLRTLKAPTGIDKSKGDEPEQVASNR